MLAAFSKGSEASWFIAFAPDQHPIQLRPPQEAPGGHHGAYPPAVANVGKRIGAEEYQVGLLPNLDAAGRPRSAKEESRVNGGRLECLE
jgi:hypothetical protein